MANLSRSINARDRALADLLTHARSVSTVPRAARPQIDQLIVDGNQLFATSTPPQRPGQPDRGY